MTEGRVDYLNGLPFVPFYILLCELCSFSDLIRYARAWSSMGPYHFKPQDQIKGRVLKTQVSPVSKLFLYVTYLVLYHVDSCKYDKPIKFLT